jgi:aminoethylphosphonate catabolism LysR family transcriptional regulator
MNFAEIRAFHAVASAGSFTRAAAGLHVSQPTLSAQVKALEARHGVRLFDRRGRRVALTALGRTLLELTRRLFSLDGEIDQLLSEAGGLQRGELRIGADAPYHVIAAVAAFSRRYPGVRLALSAGNSEQLLHGLLEHRIDVAVVANLRPDGRIHAVPVRRDRLVAFVGRDHPWARRARLRLVELAGQRLVLREPGSTTRGLFEAAMARNGLALGEVLEVGSREAVREAVAAGLGVGIVSESEFGADRRLKPLPLADETLEMVEYVACLAERRDLRLIRAFFGLVDSPALAVTKNT